MSTIVVRVYWFCLINIKNKQIINNCMKKFIKTENLYKHNRKSIEARVKQLLETTKDEANTKQQTINNNTTT